MNYAANVISVIESVVQQMTPVITITSNNVNGDGDFVLEACQTYWIHKKMKITIDSVTYTVIDFTLNTSITLRGASQPVVTSFQLNAPEFWHGSHRKVDRERTGDLRSVFVYLPKPRAIQPGTWDSDIAYTADIRPIFLMNFDEQRDTIDLQQTEVMEPCNEMADLFFALLEDDYRFEDPENFSREEWMNFGNETVWGNDKRIFKQPLSGIEMRGSLEILVGDWCECSTQQDPVICPDVTTSVEGVATITDTAPGQNIDIQIVDNVGSTVPSTLIEDTANVKKLEVTAGGPVSTSFNGVGTGVDTPSGDALAIAVINTTPTLLGTLTVNTANNKGITIPDITVTDSDGSTFTQAAGTNVTCAPIKNTATPMKSGATASFYTNDDGYDEDGRLTDWWNLEYNNWFGFQKRFTGIYGSYQDETNGLFYDKDGVQINTGDPLNDRDIAFPSEIILDWGQWYSGNSVFAFFNTRKAGTSGGTFTPILDTLSNWIANEPYTDDDGFFSGWKTVNVRQMFSILSYEGTNPFDYIPVDSAVVSAATQIVTKTIRATLTTQCYGMADTSLFRIGLLNITDSKPTFLWRLITEAELAVLNP